MIDLHTHTLLSDGELLPSEFARRAEVRGYQTIALTDHVDASNIDFVVPRIARVCKVLNKYWAIRCLPGAEITHAPVQEIAALVKLARKLGAKVVVVHGETVTEPVIRGTNEAAIKARCDIVAHPGMITEKDALLARRNNVYLELTSRSGHSDANKHVLKMARKSGARLVLDNDAHMDSDLITYKERRMILSNLGMTKGEIEAVDKNSMSCAANS